MVINKIFFGKVDGLQTKTSYGFRNNDAANSGLNEFHLLPILGEPGATSRDDAIFTGERHFWRESLFQALKSPWVLFLTKRVPEKSKSVPLIGQKNIFLANQRGDLAG